MEKDLHTTLAEAALEMYPPRIGDIVHKHCDVNADTRETLIEGGTIGYELGYKEAVEVAKEWLKEQLNYVPMDGFLAQFETDMNNKLWEKKK